MITSAMPFLSEEFISFVDKTLLQYAHDDGKAILTISALDGFLTALVSGPSMIPPSLWMPEIWGGERHQPDWSSGKQLKQFMGCVFEMFNFNSNVLSQNPENFKAIFLERSIEDKTYTIVDDWCQGYQRGVQLNPQDWLSAPETIHKQLAYIGVFAEEENIDLLSHLSDDAREKLHENIEPAARTIHDYFLNQRAMELSPSKNLVHPNKQVVRSELKIGRNDPCSCGSGKKYKKCCLTQLLLVE